MISGRISWLLSICSSYSLFLDGLKFYMISVMFAGLHPSLCGLLQEEFLDFTAFIF